MNSHTNRDDALKEAIIQASKLGIMVIYQYLDDKSRSWHVTTYHQAQHIYNKDFDKTRFILPDGEITMYS